MKKSKKAIWCFFVSLGFVLAYTIYVICFWARDTFGVGLDEIIFTLLAPLVGADSNVLLTALKFCVPRILIVIVLCILFLLLFCKLKFSVTAEMKLRKKTIKFNLSKAGKRAISLLSVFSIVLSLLYVNKQFQVVSYIKNSMSSSTIYEEYYVDPATAGIALKSEDGSYKNLLCIYLESMETTYTSLENGGEQDICYIPNLVKLAEENISFSDSEGLGGFHNVVNTGYTMGALLGTTSGVPFSFPVSGNSMDTRTKFASGLTNLGDILSQFGYHQEFLCGSNASYAGRRTYFEQHGNYEIFDYYTAQEKGYIEEDYYVFWGYEDKYLYEIAKDELLSLAEKDEPFNFTMLTVDPHHIGGYKCSLCGDEYDTQTKNVISCADRQIGAFIEWCKEQSFYEDTVIVILGDHPRMDEQMVEGVDYYDRTIYNCFINSQAQGDWNTKNRCFTSLDMFPTILHALGFEWNSDRLGLGTSMFSEGETLAESLGYSYFDGELSKKSKYYTTFY